MATPDNFFRDLQGYLHLSMASFTTMDTSPSQGGNSKINVNEKFNVSFRVTNTAPGVLSDGGLYVFNNIRVIMARTSDGFAVPLNAAGGEAETVEVPLSPNSLRAGQSGIVRFNMIAKKNMGGFMDWFMSEEIGKVRIRASFDYNTYFDITTIPKGFSLEIEP